MKIRLMFVNEMRNVSIISDMSQAARIDFSVSFNEDECIIILESQSEHKLKTLVSMNSNIIFGSWDQSNFDDLIID